MKMLRTLLGIAVTIGMIIVLPLIILYNKLNGIGF